MQLLNDWVLVEPIKKKHEFEDDWKTNEEWVTESTEIGRAHIPCTCGDVDIAAGDTVLYANQGAIKFNHETEGELVCIRSDALIAVI